MLLKIRRTGKYIRKNLEVWGNSKFMEEEAWYFNNLTNIMGKGRKEISKFRLFNRWIKKTEFDWFTASYIKEIAITEEIIELRDEYTSNDDF